jgi:hypothetical protein
VPAGQNFLSPTRVAFCIQFQLCTYEAGAPVRNLVAPKI